MEEESKKDEVDQITKVPEELDKEAKNDKKRSVSKEKDPKKVAAGKALAKRNKEAREALKNNDKKLHHWTSKQ